MVTKLQRIFDEKNIKRANHNTIAHFPISDFPLSQPPGYRWQSLAITCHRCGVNVFDYFCNIIDRCSAWPPNTPIEKYRDLLPDRWKPSQK